MRPDLAKFRHFGKLLKVYLVFGKNLNQLWQKIYEFWAIGSQIMKNITLIVTSVTRSGDLLDFGQLFKAFGNN